MDTDDIYQLLKEAIGNKRQVTAVYNGLRREMSPHCLGRKNGKRQCLFYQFGGQSSSGAIVPGSPSNWRCIPLDGLTDMRVQEGPWHTQQNHSKRQTCIDDVDIEVAF